MPATVTVVSERISARPEMVVEASLEMSGWNLSSGWPVT